MSDKPKKEELINIRVDPDRKRQAVALAKKKGMGVSVYCRSLLYAQLDEEASKAA